MLTIFHAPLIFINNFHKKKLPAKTEMKLNFLSIFDKSLSKYLTIFQKEFLKCVGYISSCLTKLDSGLE